MTTETMFGVAVSDPYRFLEDANDPATIAWTREQNAAVRAALDALSSRAVFRKRFDALLNIGSIGVPAERGGRFFYTARRGSQNQAVLFVREEGRDRILIDPAALDASGLTALDWWYPSPNGTYVAFGLSKNGDEQSTLHVLETASSRRLSEAIPRTRAASLAWFPDENGFYYTRRPADSDYDMRVYRHALHDAWENDERVFGEGRASEDWLSVDLSGNGRWLLVSAQRGWTANDVYLCDLHAARPAFIAMVEKRDAIYDVQCRGDALFIRSNEGASRYTLFAANAERPEREHWRTVVAEGEDVLDAFAVTRERIVAAYLHNAHTRLVMIDDAGNLREAPLPPFGSVAGLSARESSSDAYVLYTSFTQPATVYKLDVLRGALEIWDAIASPIDVSPYRVEQEWCRSADGTRVPLYLLSRADTPRDGSAPAVLTGYGGFNVSYLPSYFSTVVPWLDAGGVYAVANLRGGGEFGEAWHRAGMLGNKQRVFDDFIAAAEFLGKSGRADPARIGIVGGSNGGLLVSAVTVQRPELFAAVVCEVPLCDMIRFPKFLIARLWIAEYGDPENAEDFHTLYAYSPYHHVRAGQAYPAMFFRTAESDSRVDPLHARKMGARLQAATSSGRPVLVHIERQAGHGAGKPRDKQVEDLSDRWSFLAWRLGVEIRPH